MTICSPTDERKCRWGRPFLRRFLGLAVLATTLVVTAPVYADNEPSIEAMLEQLDDQELSDVSDSESGLPESTVNAVNVELQWSLWKRALHEEQDPGLSELSDLREDSRSLGRPSLPHHQLAVIDIARRADDFGLNEDQAVDLFEAAHDLAPHLPYARLERVHWQASHDFTSIPYTIPSYLGGLQQSYHWLDTRVGWSLKYGLLLLIALGLGFVGFSFAQLLRYFGIAAYDGTRLLPKGFSSTQTVILLVALVLVPGLVMQSPILSLFLLSLLVIPFQQLNERFVALCFFIVLAALPWVDDHLGQFLTYPGSDAQQLLHANYHGCDDDCRTFLDDLADEDRGLARLIERSDYFRNANREELLTLHEWLDTHQPATTDDGFSVQWLTLEGAVLIAIGEFDDAIDVLESATDADPEAVEAWFNRARAHQLLDEDDASRQALGYALASDRSRASHHLDLSHRDPHSFLMVPRADADQIWREHAPSTDEAPSLVTPMWAIIAGDEVDLDWALGLGVGGIVFLLLTLPLYLKRRVSTPCPKCGLARDPTDTDQTADHHYCLPCYQTFVSGASLDYHARVHSEATLGRRDRLQQLMRRAFSLLTPGLGHVLAGHAIRGILTFLFFAAAILLLLFPAGPFGAWTGPFELFRTTWSGSIVLAWILLSIGASVGLTGLIRGIEPTRRRSSDSRHGKPS